MAGIITGLQFQKRNKERVNVYIDGEFAFGLDAVQAAGLRKGQELTAAEIETLKQQDAKRKALDQAMRFLSFRPRSQAEVETYLKKKKVDDETISEIIGRLKELEYLDDEAFARFWIENRQRFKPRSKLALRYELQQKGIDRDVAAVTTADVDEEEAAWQAVENKLSRWYNYPLQDFQRKVYDFLRRRGFHYEIIKTTFARACQELGIDCED
jgi:regulatory protein